MWKIGTVRGYNRGWTSDIYTEKTPDFRRFKYSFNKRSLRLILLYPWKNEKFNQNIIHWTITLITPLFGIVHFKTNYNYRLSNHCFINELILVTYALISNAVENLFFFFLNQNMWVLKRTTPNHKVMDKKIIAFYSQKFCSYRPTMKSMLYVCYIQLFACWVSFQPFVVISVKPFVKIIRI